MTHELKSQESEGLGGSISRELVRVIKRHTGRGPTKAYTIMGGDYVVSFFREPMTATEQALTDQGHEEFVAQIRAKLHAAMREDVQGVVERVTGRKVLALLADHHADPDIGMLACLLEPGKRPPLLED